MNSEIKNYIDNQLDIIRKLCDICLKCKITKLYYPPPTTCNYRPPYCIHCDKVDINKVNNKNESYDDMEFGKFD